MPQAPFYEKNVNCPCCKNQVNIFFLPDVTSRLYFAKEKEDDQHVTLWQWKNPSFSHINPYYYDVLFCPECSYADLRDVFLQPQKNPSNNINNICKFLSQETNNSDSLINKFIEKISFENMNFESAIYLHLLAIKTQKLMPGPEPQENPKNNRNWKLIGRLFLRLAWLFREQSGGSNKTQVQEGYVSNLRTSIDALIKKTSMMQPDIESFLSYLIKEKEYEEKTKIYQNPIFNKYMVNFKNIKDNYTNIKKAVNNLKEVNKIHINLLKDLVPGFQDESSDIGNELLS